MKLISVGFLKLSEITFSSLVFFEEQKGALNAKNITIYEALLYSENIWC